MVASDILDRNEIVYALAVSPDFAVDRVCFAARSSGLYRSEDAGRTWCAAYDSLALPVPLATSAVAVSPGFASDGTVFAGARRHPALHNLERTLT